MSNNDENKHPSSAKKSTTRQTQYRILTRNQLDQSTCLIKNPDALDHDVNTPTKCQRNKCKFNTFLFLNQIIINHLYIRSCRPSSD